MLKRLLLVLLALSILPASAGLVLIHHSAIAPPPTVTSISCIPNNLAATVVAGTVVCPVTFTPSGSTGTLTVSGTNAASFTISGSNVVAATTLPAGSYVATVTASAGSTLVSTNFMASIAPVAGAQFPTPDLSTCNFTLPTSFGNVWYIDPVNGQTENTMTTAGVSMNPAVNPHQGDINHPWNSLQAVFGTSGALTTGYSHILLAAGRIDKGPIQGGDEILLMNGTAAQYGAIGVGSFGYSINNSSYVTIAAAPGQTPVLTNLFIENVQNLAFEGITIQSKTPVNGHLLEATSNGAVTKNIVLDHMSVSSTDYATMATYTTNADWTTNVSGIGGPVFATAQCTKFSNSHVFLVDGGIGMATPSQLLIQNNEVDHFVTDGVDFEGFNVIIQGNYIHDTIDIQNGAHQDGMQGDGNEVLNGGILIDGNKIIQTTSSSKPLLSNDVLGGYNGLIGVTNNQWSYLVITNNILVGQQFSTGISIGGCTNCMVANNTVPDRQIRCLPTNLGDGSLYNNSNIQMKNNLALTISSRFPSGTRAADPVGCLFSNNVVFAGGAGGNTNSWNCNGATVDTNTPGTYACGMVIDAGGVATELTTFNDTTYTYNFSLLSTAPARGAGTAVAPTPQTDYAANPMNAPPDVGALQFQGAAPANVAFSLPTGSTLKYMASNGNDNCNGTSPSIGSSGNCAWASPRHSMNCGEVIIAEPGTYATPGGFPLFVNGDWGTVSNCPSTSGGIDGTGGIYFAILLCAGPNLGACNGNGQGGEVMRIDQSHWAVEGWNGTQANNATGGCFDFENDSNSVETSFNAFVNNVASSCDLDGFGTSGGAGGLSVDFIANVGVVSYNGAQSHNGFDICGSGISDSPGPTLSGPAGTHVFVDGAFLAYNTNTSGTGECNLSGNGNFPHTDGEGIIFDSYGGGYPGVAGGYTGQVVLENAVIWHSGNAAVQIFPNGGAGTDLAQYHIKNVTSYADNQDARGNCGGSELWLHGIYPTSTGSYSITNSLFEGVLNTCGNQSTGNPVFVVNIAPANCVILANPPVTVSANYVFNSATPANVGEISNYNSSCAGITVPLSTFGTNTTTTPGLTSPASLFSTSPDCSSYTNVTDCMNTGQNVYANVRPTTAPATMGYQPPGACAADSLYPTWLKGIVYLHWNGTSITENSGLVTKPCGL